MKFYNINLLMIPLIWISCSTPDKQKESVESPTKIMVEEVNITDLMVGKWDSKILKVNKPTVGGSDQTEIIDVNPDNYEAIVGLKTATIYFFKDSTYREEYILPDNQIAFTQEGIWRIDGDSLITLITSPSVNEFKYHLRIEGDTAFFTARMDYDGDGEKDDDFYGVSVRDLNY